MKIEVYKLTQDNWHPNYFLEGNERQTNLVRVFINQISPPGREEVWRVAVWGNDDIGMDKDFEGKFAEQDATVEFQVVCLQQFVNLDWLKSRGWKNSFEICKIRIGRSLMGCHTWFYTKVHPQPTYEYVLSRVIEDHKSLLMEDPEFFPEFFRNPKAYSILQRQLRIMEKGLCKRAVCRRYMHGGATTQYIDGKGFYVTTNYLPHDLFRVKDYPEDVLYSLEECLEFIQVKDISYCHDNFRKHLERFWIENPEGLVQFG